jgi:hypothetical protein
MRLALAQYPNQRYYKKVKTNISHEHRCKNLQQNIIKLNTTKCKKITFHEQLIIIPGMQG